MMEQPSVGNRWRRCQVIRPLVLLCHRPHVPSPRSQRSEAPPTWASLSGRPSLTLSPGRQITLPFLTLPMDNSQCVLSPNCGRGGGAANNVEARRDCSDWGH